MHYRVEAWKVARALLGEVRGVINWERRMRRRAERLERETGILPPEFKGADLIGQAAMATVIASNFRGIERHLTRLEDIPQEHRLFEPTESPIELASVLGRLAGKQVMTLHRYLPASSLDFAA